MSHQTESTYLTIIPRGARGHRAVFRGVTLAAVIGLGVGLAACGGDTDTAAAADADTDTASVAAAEPDAARPPFGMITPEQAQALAAVDDVVVIDVRTPEEFAEGHIDGATMIDFNAPSFADEVAKLDPAAEYLVYCRSDNRSGQAVQMMQGLGFERVWDMDGGVVAWTEEGRPLVR